MIGSLDRGQKPTRLQQQELAEQQSRQNKTQFTNQTQPAHKRGQSTAAAPGARGEQPLASIQQQPNMAAKNGRNRGEEEERFNAVEKSRTSASHRPTILQLATPRRIDCSRNFNRREGTGRAVGSSSSGFMETVPNQMPPLNRAARASRSASAF